MTCIALLLDGLHLRAQEGGKSTEGLSNDKFVVGSDNGLTHYLLPQTTVVWLNSTFGQSGIVANLEIVRFAKFDVRWDTWAFFSQVDGLEATVHFSGSVDVEWGDRPIVRTR